jgi:hypothetical protein
MILGFIAAPLGCLFSMLHLGLWLGILILHIFAIVKGVNGQRLIIPYISEYADKF